jgi:DNA-binding MarR family transcriptional regulator
MTSRVPQVLVSLSAEGGLVVELPGQQATRRQVFLRTSEAGETLLRILQAQSTEGVELGLDGAPTQAQVLHWERHGIWPDSRCRFCLAEKRIKPTVPRRKLKELILSRPDGVEVKRIKTGAKGQRVQSTDKSMEDLGL